MRCAIINLNDTISLKLRQRLRYPKFRGGKLKIGAIDFDYFLNREIQRAVKSLGHEVIRIKGNKDASVGEMLGKVARPILDFKPDFLLTINHLGFDEEGILTNFLESIEMPVASWYVDSPNIIVKGYEKNVSPYVSIFLWDRSYIKDIQDMGFESVDYLPLATDEDVFRPIKLNHSGSKRYTADIGFAGASWVERIEEELEGVPEDLHPCVEKIAQILSYRRIPFTEALQTLSEIEINRINTLTSSQRLDLEAAVYWKATMLYRLACMKVMKEFQPVIYGDKYWEELLGEEYKIRPHLNYYKELPLFYNACKINFNATSLQMLKAVNQRVFDVPACGAFLLTDYQEAIGELFEIGSEVITYKDRDEIPDLIRFYLGHPELRNIISDRARKRILKEHTYKRRLNTIIDLMKERYG